MKKGKFEILSDGTLAFWCEGCRSYHGVCIDKDKPVHWDFNGDYNKPTIRPSILVRGTIPPTDEEVKRILNHETFEPVEFRCHSFITDGKIQYLSDCTHKLAGQTVELEEDEE